MEIQFYGANCIAINYKQARVVVDDNLSSLGSKAITKSTDISLFTSYEIESKNNGVQGRIVIDGPGEYEVGKIFIYGIEARSHLDESDGHLATIYKLIIGNLNVIILGHVYPELNDKQLENLGMVDVLILPVGGHGYTLDAQGANKLIKAIEPKIIVPTHYADKSLNFEVPQDNLEDVLKNLGMTPAETISKLKLKSSDIIDVRKLIVLEKG